MHLERQAPQVIVTFYTIYCSEFIDLYLDVQEPIQNIMTNEANVWDDESNILYIEYDENGKIKERKIGHENGQTAQHEIYENGKLIEARMWNENGKLILLNVSDGIIKERRSWHENGALLRKASYRGDTLVGEFKFGYENGLSIFHFYLGGKCRDRKFTINRKIILLQFKNQLHQTDLRAMLHSSKTFLISDLFGIVITHI